MKEAVKEYIHSGIIELYLLGMTAEEENRDLDEAAKVFPEIKEALKDAAKSFEEFGQANAVAPPAPIKAFLFGTIDYMERLEAGETPTTPPALSENSTIADFAPWLERDDMTLPVDAEDTFVKIIGSDADRTTAIVWAKTTLPAEIHDDELESFLVIEGSCEIDIDDHTHYLKPGDFLTIPLYADHIARITSDIPCKLIVQRAAVAA